MLLRPRSKILPRQTPLLDRLFVLTFTPVSYSDCFVPNDTKEKVSSNKFDTNPVYWLETPSGAGGLQINFRFVLFWDASRTTFV
jgi:hypothetical protein